MSTNQPTPSLHGCRIALIGASDDPISPASDLLARGAEAVYYPAAQLLPPDNDAALEMALTRCIEGEAEWLLLPTPHAVEAVAAWLTRQEMTPDALHPVKLALYGTMTALTAASHLPNVTSALPPSTTHQQLIDAMNLTQDDRVIVPLTQHARSDWSNLIDSTGAEAITVPAYRLIVGRGGDDLPGMLWGGLIDALVFLTESSVRHFSIRLKLEGGSLDMLEDVAIVCLDPQTAIAARAYDLNVHITATDGDFATLAESIAHHLNHEVVNV